MTEYRKQAAFLKGLMVFEDNVENRQLLERLEQAEKNERCLIMACWLVGLIALFGLAGLGYSAVLLPQFFDGSAHLLIRLFGALGLGSGLCLLSFLALWLWYRVAVNRIHEECRQVILKMLEVRLSTTTTTYYPQPTDAVIEVLSESKVGNMMTDLSKLPKAS